MFIGDPQISLSAASEHHVPACRISVVLLGSLLFGLSAASDYVPACRISVVFLGSLLFGLSVAFVHHVPACRTSIVFIDSLLFGLAAAFVHHVPACRISLVTCCLVLQQPLCILCLHAESVSPAEAWSVD